MMSLVSMLTAGSAFGLCSLFAIPGSLAFFSMPGGWEWLLIAVVALLLFGKRLPDVARSFGKSIVEFKKGIRDVQDDLNRNDSQRNLPSSEQPAPKLEGKNESVGSTKP